MPSSSFDAEIDIYEARQIAKAKGYIVVVKPFEFMLFRRAEPKNVFVGKRTTAGAMRKLVEQVCVDKPNIAV